MNRTIELAQEAGRTGNLPIGAVICLDDRVVAEGKNAIWLPGFALYRYAELEALRAIPADLSQRFNEMTLYSTLEPSLLCAGAILPHSIERVIFGTADDYGGIGITVAWLPPFFAEQYALGSWIGPDLSRQCDMLYKRVTELEREHEDWGWQLVSRSTHSLQPTRRAAWPHAVRRAH